MRPGNNFLLEINAVDAISFSSYQNRRDHLRDPAQHAAIEVNLAGELPQLNKIDIIPRKI